MSLIDRIHLLSQCFVFLFHIALLLLLLGIRFIHRLAVDSVLVEVLPLSIVPSSVLIVFVEERIILELKSNGDAVLDDLLVVLVLRIWFHVRVLLPLLNDLKRAGLGI